MRKKIIICVALILAVLAALSVYAFADYKNDNKKTVCIDGAIEENVKNNTTVYSAEDLRNAKEDIPEYSKDSIETAKKIAEDNYDMLLGIAKEAITQKYTEFASVDPDNLTVGFGYSYSGNDPQKYGIEITFRHSLFGILTNEYYSVKFYTTDGVDFEAKCVMANLCGQFSAFDNKITEESFVKASDEVIAKFENELALCQTTDELSKIWLSVCDCPVGVENHSDLLCWRVIDSKLNICIGAFDSEYKCKLD